MWLARSVAVCDCGRSGGYLRGGQAGGTIGLGLGAGFGYLMLANSGLTLIVATCLGTAGALVAEVAVGRRRAGKHALQTVGTPCALSPGVA